MMPIYVPCCGPQVEKAIKDAEETCTTAPSTPDCAVAWDEVEEMSAAVSHKKATTNDDPLEVRLGCTHHCFNGKGGFCYVAQLVLE